MRWYAAHLIMVAKFKDKCQDKYPIWENVILLSANSDDEALSKAEKRGKEDESGSESEFLWEGRPAIWTFVGVRKLIECVDTDTRPGDGTEITYSELELGSEDALAKLVAGEPVIVNYQE